MIEREYLSKFPSVASNEFSRLYVERTDKWDYALTPKEIRVLVRLYEVRPSGNAAATAETCMAGKDQKTLQRDENVPS